MPGDQRMEFCGHEGIALFLARSPRHPNQSEQIDRDRDREKRWKRAQQYPT